MGARVGKRLTHRDLFVVRFLWGLRIFGFWKYVVFQSVFVGLFPLASIYDGCLLDGGSHRPIDHPVIVEVGDLLSVKPADLSV
jgi:hypothetical protein